MGNSCVVRNRDVRSVNHGEERELTRGRADNVLDPGVHREHLLLTVLGTYSKPARYTLEGREVEARLAPVALLELLPEVARPDRVLALCTLEAEQSSLGVLEDELIDCFPIEVVRVPGGGAQQDVDTFLGEVVGSVGQGAELTVDVTHGFRHFSFLTYFAVLYLAALRGVKIRGAYYGMLNPTGPSPLS